MRRLGLLDENQLSGRHGPCPICGGRDRFRFDDKDGSGSFFCQKQCGAGGGADLVMKIRGVDFAEAAKLVEEVLGSASVTPLKPKADEEARRDSLRRVWRSGAPIAPTNAAGRWLMGRVGRLPNSKVLRFVPRLHHRDDAGQVSHHPGMIALLSDVNDKAVTLHRTYLTEDGRKASVESPRKLMAGPVTKGVAVRLCPQAATLGVAEGIETALAASALFEVPVWAAINSSMLEAWQPPDGVREVIVFGDHDLKFGGQAAAFALAHRLACDDRLGVSVRVEMPERVGDDWNDVLLAQREAA